MSISGYASLSFVYAITYLNLPDINTGELFRKVDLSDEVCTLYPRANITIIPTHRIVYSDKEIYRYFHDAMKAQNVYIKADNIIFDMRYYQYFNPHRRCYDNLEYLYMLQHNLEYNIACYKQNAYVIFTEDPLWVSIESASREEINALRRQE